MLFVLLIPFPESVEDNAGKDAVKGLIPLASAVLHIFLSASYTEKEDKNRFLSGVLVPSFFECGLHIINPFGVSGEKLPVQRFKVDPYLPCSYWCRFMSWLDTTQFNQIQKGGNFVLSTYKQILFAASNVASDVIGVTFHKIAVCIYC